MLIDHIICRAKGWVGDKIPIVLKAKVRLVKESDLEGLFLGHLIGMRLKEPGEVPLEKIQKKLRKEWSSKT